MGLCQAMTPRERSADTGLCGSRAPITGFLEYDRGFCVAENLQALQIRNHTSRNRHLGEGRGPEIPLSAGLDSGLHRNDGKLPVRSYPDERNRRLAWMRNRN